MLGAGNTGFAVAANLTLAGHSVTLAELPAFPEAINPLRASRTIELLGVAHTGAVPDQHHLSSQFRHWREQREG